MRNRFLAIILIAGCFVSPLAYALGLGDIEVYSALNQPLAAEIELSSVRPGETDNMWVRLASEEAFLQAGVERHFYLTKIKFNLAVKPDGTQYINITTQGPVREPFLSFLIDVDWPRGRLVREYTVLLDPPVFAGAQKPASTEPQTAPAAAAVSAAGTPALIERSKVAAAEDDFGFDDDDAAMDAPLEPTADVSAAEFEEIDSASEIASYDDEGFGVTEKAEPADLTAGLPDIAIHSAAEEDVSSDAEFTSEPVDEFEIEDEFAPVAAAEFAEEVPEESLAIDTPDTEYEYLDDADEDFTAALDDAGEDFTAAEDSYLDDSQQFPYEDDIGDLESEYEDSILDSELPDIALFYDASLPYDEEATNVLLAQFAAEDEARERGEFIDSQDDHEVVTGDSLYAIANKYKAPDVTVNQAMLSILRYNPDAFIKDNINNVKKGFVLRIPDRNSMLRIDSTEAMTEVRQQHTLWREYRDQLVGAPSAVQDAQTADDLYIAERDTGREQLTGGELSILSPGRDAESSARASGAQEGSEGGSSLYIDLQLAREQLQAERLEKEELQARLTDLSSQIEKMDRIISLKDEQLAQLQQRLGEVGGQTDDAEQYVDDTADLLADTDAAQEFAAEEALQITEEDEQATALEPAIDDMAAADEFDESLALTDTGATETPLGEEDSSTLESELDASQQEEELISETGTDTAVPELADVGPDTVADDSVAEETAADTIDEPAIAEAPVEPQPRQREGLAAYAFDLLPSPLNVMAADFLETAYGVPVLAVLVALLLVLLFIAAKPKKPESSELAADAPIEEAAEEEAGDAYITMEPAKPGFAERLSAMFAPLTALFAGKKSSIAKIAAQADHAAVSESDEAKETPEDQADSEAVIEDLGEIESFDETAKSAAEETTEAEQTITAADQGSVAEAVVAPVEEETSDDTTQEADVYLAYGLHDQAEELLTQALANDPNKTEYKGKLLETYYAAGKKAEFESLATQLHDDLGGRSSQAWDKAIAMGKEIAPDNPLFTAAEGAGLKVSDFAPAKPETADLDLSEASGSTTPDIAFGDEDDSAVVSTDFDLDLGEGAGDGEGESDIDSTVLVTPDSDDKTEIMQSVDVDASLGGETDLEFDLDADVDDLASDLEIDFNADELGLGTDAEAEDLDSNASADDGDATVAMDVAFDIDDENDDKTVALSADDAIELDLGDSDEINLDDLDDVDADVFQADSSASDDLLADLDLGNDDLEGAAVDTEFEIPPDEDTIIDADLDDDTLSGDIGDEVSTKLDLAKAYMDMGDYDGASSTLEEVVAEGDDSQQREAKELLDQIH